MSNHTPTITETIAMNSGKTSNRSTAATVRRVWRAVACGLAMATASCDENALSPTDAFGVTWRLESIEPVGAAAMAPGDPSRYTIRLEPDGRLSVRADCNTCGGMYDLRGAMLTVQPTMACTRAFCGVQSLDTPFVAGLSGAHTLALGTDALVLRGDRGTLRFRR